MSVRRIFAEKKEPYAVKAQELMEEMSSYLDIHDAKKVKTFRMRLMKRVRELFFRSRRSMIFMRAPSLMRRMILFFQ
mgnify:CR=1 FL=1